MWSETVSAIGIALWLSLKVAFFATVLNFIFAVLCAAVFFKFKNRFTILLESILSLPMVLPPTVLGYYLLVGLGGKSFLGFPLVFSFTGILIASLIVNLPFAIQPIQRAFEAINPEIREAAQGGARTLKEAVSEAIRDWVTNVADTHYIIGSAVGPAPYPSIVRAAVSPLVRSWLRSCRFSI